MLIPKRRRHFIYINKTVDAARHPFAASLWSVSRTYYIGNGICIVQEKLSVSALLRCSLLTRTAASTNSATYKFELYIPLESLSAWNRVGDIFYERKNGISHDTLPPSALMPFVALL